MCVDETEDFIDGKLPCISCKKNCKHLEHQKARDIGLQGDPRRYLSAGGLQEFHRVSAQIFNLSPCTEHGVPTVSALNWYDGDIDMDSRQWNDCLELKLLHETRRAIKRMRK